MPWTIAGIRIYVEKDTGWETTPRLAEINILDSFQTIVHEAGRPSYTRSLGFVVFSGYFANIAPLADGVAHALVSDQGAEGDVFIKSLKPTRLLDISRVTVVTRVAMDLIKDGV
ncbi:unnamed protein product [marine sediment metagenome]|uniref:Uncharacterized protein n=1 Tax=marine sediment metagenome TaxID=412755 RepID=X1D7H0_9ZZZZ